MWETIKKNKEIIGTTIVINLIVTILVGAVVLSIVPRVSIQNNGAITPLIGSNKSEESSIIKIVERSNPAVVSIVVTKDVPIQDSRFNSFDFFREFFGQDPFSPLPQQPQQGGTEEVEIGGGSGLIVSADGLVVTNRHVAADPDADYTIFTNDGKKYVGEVIARDSVLDIAVLKIKGGTNFPYLVFGDSDTLKPGQTVIAIGNALGEFRNSVSVGVVSGLSRSIVAGDGLGASELLEEVIQTDAAINPGNSGGPLLNLKGEVIGVNVAVARGSENIGFALPANTVKGVVDSVKQFGEIIRPYIGVRYVLINEQIQQENNLTVDYGALIIRGDSASELAVVPNSPADKAGLRENDIILEVDGVKVEQGKTLAALVRKKKVGDTITLTVLSQGKIISVRITLEKAPN